MEDEKILEEVDTVSEETVSETSDVVAEEPSAPTGYVKKYTLTQEQKVKQGVSVSSIVGKVLIYTFLIAFALWTILPILIGFLISFTPNEHLSETVSIIIPKKIDFSNYVRLLTDKQIGKNTVVELPFAPGKGAPSILVAFVFTCILVLPPTILGLFTSAMSAFAFAKLNFKGKNLMFGGLLFTMMIPGAISLVPAFSIYLTLFEMGLWDAFPLFVPGMFGSAGCVFFLKQYFTGIPTDLMEAAKLDGMGYFKMFFKIIVPLSGAALIAQGILGFVGGYNDYFGPMLYLTDYTFQTLQVTLTKLQSSFVKEPAVVMTACMIALIPTLIIYLFAQRFFVEGIATSGLKI